MFIFARQGDKAVDSACISSVQDMDYSDMASKDFVDELRDFFKPENEKLYEILGRRFDWTHSDAA